MLFLLFKLLCFHATGCAVGFFPLMNLYPLTCSWPVGGGIICEATESQSVGEDMGDNHTSLYVEGLCGSVSKVSQALLNHNVHKPRSEFWYRTLDPALEEQYQNLLRGKQKPPALSCGRLLLNEFMHALRSQHSFPLENPQCQR